jgi:hypothetical protein
MNHRLYTRIAASARVIASIALVLSAAACGGTTGLASPTSTTTTAPTATTTPTATPATTASTTPQAETATTLRRQLVSYLAAFGGVRAEITAANHAAAQMTSDTNAGNYDGAAIYADEVARHLAAAHVRAAAIHPPGLLRPSHADFVRMLSLGSRMAQRMATDFRTRNASDLKQHVLPMQTQARRLANGWYHDVAGTYLVTGHQPPHWLLGLMTWD